MSSVLDISGVDDVRSSQPTNPAMDEFAMRQDVVDYINLMFHDRNITCNVTQLTYRQK